MLSSNILRKIIFQHLKSCLKKLRDERINVSRETVRRKFKQIGYVSKPSVECYELSLQQKEVRLK